MNFWARLYPMWIKWIVEGKRQRHSLSLRAPPTMLSILAARPSGAIDRSTILGFDPTSWAMTPCPHRGGHTFPRHHLYHMILLADVDLAGSCGHTATVYSDAVVPSVSQIQNGMRDLLAGRATSIELTKSQALPEAVHQGRLWCF